MTNAINWTKGKIDELMELLTNTNSTTDLPLYKAIKSELDEYAWKLAELEERELKAQVAVIRNDEFSGADLAQWFSVEGCKLYRPAQAAVIRDEIGAKYRHHRDLQERAAATGQYVFAETNSRFAEKLQVAFTNLHERAAQTELLLSTAGHLGRIRFVMCDGTGSTFSADQLPVVMVGEQLRKELHRGYAGHFVRSIRQYGDELSVEIGNRPEPLVPAAPAPLPPELIDTGAEIQLSEIQVEHLSTEHLREIHAAHRFYTTSSLEMVAAELEWRSDPMSRPGSLGRPGRCKALDAREELRSEKERRQAAGLHPDDCFCSVCDFYENTIRPIQDEIDQLLLPADQFLHIRPSQGGLEIEVVRYEDGALGTGKVRARTAGHVIDDRVSHDALAESLDLVIENLRSEVAA